MNPGRISSCPREDFGRSASNFASLVDTRIERLDPGGSRVSRFEETNMADVGRWIGRFGPYIALVASVALVVGFLPGDDDSGGLETGSGVSSSGGFEMGADGDEADGATESDASRSSVTLGGEGAGGGSGSGAGGSGAGGQTSAGGGDGGTSGGGGTKPLATADGLVANCDPATGRIKIPTVSAPACVPAFDGDNGGPTVRGVTGDTIKVAVFRPESNPAAEAILAAAGAEDSEEETRQQYQEWFDLYSAHFETYGRKVELVFVPASGGADDDAAARSDAIKVADEIGAFASISAPNNTYTDELAARGVMCIGCAISQPAEYYLKNAPYAWGSLMASTSGYTHGLELIEKQGGGKAEFAGDPVLQQQERRYGLLWYETPDGAYKAGTEFFLRELDRRGLRHMLAAEGSFRGYPDLQANQEQARPLIQKMKAAGANALIMASDPFAPIFFTQEATRQQYFPEWIVTGSALTDTSFFARTYDQAQWANAYGRGNLPARLPEELSAAFRLFNWHYGRGPTADGGYAVLGAPVAQFMTGVHYAGERLSAETFRDGMFNAPISGQGTITVGAVSYGRKIWPFDDYNALDDLTYIWWDPQAQGEDELGAKGVGLYRYVDGGKRYLPGQHLSEVPWFDPAGTVTVYEEIPPSDRAPDYPPPNR